jgi:hypothetical protein
MGDNEDVPAINSLPECRMPEISESAVMFVLIGC